MADVGLHIGRFLILLVGIFCLSSAALQQDRKITIKEYHCQHNISECENKKHSIIDVIAESDDDRSVIHYLWSVIGSPTIIAAYFEKTDVNLALNWTEILKEDSKEGIHFSEKSKYITPKYITAFVIPTIYEFQDPKDELFYTGPDVKQITKHPFQTENVSWESPEVDHKHNMTTFKASMLGGSVIFQCNASASQGTESVLPHQKYTSNSTVFTLTLDHLKMNEKNTRFIFELVSFSIDKVSTCITAKRSLDDEYTPAVFKTIVVNSTGFTGTSYSAWKPVAYINKSRSLDHQVPSWAYYGNRRQSVKTTSCTSLPSSSSKQFHSIVHHLKGITFTSNEMNISFGQKKDGWYEASPYLSWSAMVGYGRPEYDSFSTVVWIIIFVGFGAPMLLIVISIVYIIVKKIKAKKTTTSYGMIN